MVCAVISCLGELKNTLKGVKSLHYQQVKIFLPKTSWIFMKLFEIPLNYASFEALLTEREIFLSDVMKKDGKSK